MMSLGLIPATNNAEIILQKIAGYGKIINFVE